MVYPEVAIASDACNSSSECKLPGNNHPNKCKYTNCHNRSYTHFYSTHLETHLAWTGIFP